MPLNTKIEDCYGMDAISIRTRVLDRELKTMVSHEDMISGGSNFMEKTIQEHHHRAQEQLLRSQELGPQGLESQRLSSYMYQQSSNLHNHMEERKAQYAYKLEQEMGRNVFNPKYEGAEYITKPQPRTIEQELQMETDNWLAGIKIR